MTDRDKDQMHPEDLRNLFIFFIVAATVWFLFDHYLLKPKVEALRAAEETQRTAQLANLPQMADELALKPRAEVLSTSAERIMLKNGHISGSVVLKGGRLDDLNLLDYMKTLHGQDPIDLFSPAGSFHPRYISFGWIDSKNEIKTPGKDDIWRVVNDAQGHLSPGKTLTIYWENGHGLRFERDITMDEGFLLTVTQRVVNKSGAAITLYPYSLMTQRGLPENMMGRWIIHEGPIGYIGDELIELSYKKIAKKPSKEISADSGWLGITDHYWLTALFPEDKPGSKFRFTYLPPQSGNAAQARYQTDAMGPAHALSPGAYIENTTRIYAGPKKLKTLEDYQKQFGWKHIDLSIDFGMYYFMTKPLYSLLHWLGDKVGNFGIGIILLTFIVRIFVFPLANTSYRSFAGLRKIAPQMQELREKCGDDKQKLQEGLVSLYEKEKVNPMAGCLPILIQIPIFFALFKVLQISVEMRHAPFYGWVHDLSAPDPTTVFNLFGLIPWDPPQMLMIGGWPCIMLFFMIIQKMMNPPPQDKMQKTMMDIMPFFITYILAQYAVGLVIYWTFSNALSVVQQYIIMKSMGVEPHLFKSKEEKEMEKAIDEGPAVHPGLEVIEHDVEEALFGDEDDQNKTISESKEKKPVSKPKPKKSKKKK